MDSIISVTPDSEKAKSILKMSSVRSEMITTLNQDKFTSLVVENYYEIIKELITAIMLLDGFKTLSHVELIQYLKNTYKDDFLESEYELIDQLRKIRNRIAYDGFFVNPDYIFLEISLR